MRASGLRGLVAVEVNAIPQPQNIGLVTTSHPAQRHWTDLVGNNLHEGGVAHCHACHFSVPHVDVLFRERVWAIRGYIVGVDGLD